MAGIRLHTIIDCETTDSAQAHALGQELEDRIHAFLTSQLPNIRHSQAIQSGTITFRLEVRGRRVKITSNRSGEAQVENPKKKKKK